MTTVLCRIGPLKSLSPTVRITNRLTPRTSFSSRTRINTVICAQQQRPDSKQFPSDLVIAGTGVALSAAVVLAFRMLSDPIDGYVDSYDSYDALGLTLGAGDLVGAAFWGLSMYFTSPIDSIALFFGRIETERPSDWLIKQLGIASGLDVNALDYSAPITIRLATILAFAISGLAVAASFSALLGDATWSVSTGIGSCLVAGLYELGRPERLSPEQAQILELQWQDFSAWGDVNLKPVGRCHESEIFKRFRGAYPKYGTEDVVTDARLRDMVRNWNPDVERSSNGYYKNVSVKTVEEKKLAQQI